METNKNKIGIIILNYNNSWDTIQCIDSIYKYTSTDIFKILIVDNGSNSIMKYDLITELIKKYSGLLRITEDEKIKILEEINILYLKTNIGYARGNNEGIKFLHMDDSIKYVLILNNDIIFTGNILPKLVTYLECIKDSAIVSPLLYKKDMKTIDYNCCRKDYLLILLVLEYTLFYYDIFKLLTRLRKKRNLLLSNPELLQKSQVKMDLPSGSCMLIKKSILKLIDGFDPKTFLYWEENILSAKIKKMKLNNYLIPSLSCIHIGASTVNKNKLYYFTGKCNYESMLYYLNNYTTEPFIIKWYLKIIGKIFLNKVRIKQYLYDVLTKKA